MEKKVFFIASSYRYELLSVAAESNAPQFKADLKAHQEGQTDYATFCNDCARSGVAHWEVDMYAMTCTYYDQAGIMLLVEKIPRLV